MKVSSLTLAVTLVFGSVSAAKSTAQTRFCVGGNLTHLTSEQRLSCNAKLQAVRKAAMSLPVPADWHVVVVCGEDGWKAYTEYAAEANSARLATVSSDTDLQSRETFLRSDDIPLDSPQSLNSLLARALDIAPREAARSGLRIADE